MINRLIPFLLFFTFSYSFPFNNEINGKFIYDTDINKNELYLFNNLLELNTYDLETGLLKYSRQITIIKEDLEKHFFGWIKPQPNKFSVMPVLLSAFGFFKLFNLTSNLNGGRRAMVPTGVFETLMPQDFLPTQMLRALLVMDTDVAQSLGALELDEEDLALCTFACPAKYEYGSALRDSLQKIEKEG